MTKNNYDTMVVESLRSKNLPIRVRNTCIDIVSNMCASKVFMGFIAEHLKQGFVSMVH